MSTRQPATEQTERTRLAAAVSLPDFVYCRGLDLVYRHRQHRATCPWHADHSTALLLSWSSCTGWRWRCRTCRLHGDAIDFIQQLDRVGLEEAMVEAERYAS